MSPNPSHLDIESPLFEGKSHIWIQWKGTNVCCDINCDCGYSGHFDGDFFYFFRCPGCSRVFEVGTHMPTYPVTDNRADAAIVHDLEQESEQEI